MPLNKTPGIRLLTHQQSGAKKEQFDLLRKVLQDFEEYILDENGYIVNSNLTGVTITGYDEWDLQGRHFSIFYSVEDQVNKQFEIDMQKAALKGFAYSIGIKVKKRNALFWGRVKIISIINGTGALCGYRAIIKDYTHKVAPYRKYLLNQENYLSVLNNPFVGYFLIRLDTYKVTCFNARAKEIFGLESISSFDSYFVKQTQFEQLISLTKQNGNAALSNIEIWGDRKTKRWVSISCQYIKEKGIIKGVVLDNTEQKILIDRSDRFSQELEAFVYHASHDLRSPITSIYGLLNLMRKDRSHLLVDKYTKLIESRVFALDGILRDIMEIAYNSSTEIQLEKIDLEFEVAFIVDTCKKTFPGVDHQVKLKGLNDVEFISDRTRVRSILRNVISNAYKYSQPTIPNRYVSISANLSKRKMEVVVEDNGIGIYPERIAKIFTLFYKGNEKNNGNGLGLYIVKAMLSRIGGDVSISSEPGLGTKVTINFPNYSR